MKDDESDAHPASRLSALAHSAHITLLLFSHTGLREASHGHLEARRLTTSQFIKNKQKNSMLPGKLGSRTTSPELEDTESP